MEHIFKRKIYDKMLDWKQSASGETASLDAFFDKFHSRIKQQYIVYTKDLHRDGALTCLPVYMTMFL